MLISFRKKFIFIHNYKVAGTSIRKKLHPHEASSFYYASRLMQRFGLYRNERLRIFSPHVRADTIQIYLPRSIYDNYFKFGFVRNPWDWQVSLYNYMRINKKHPQHQLVHSLRTFDAYIDWRIRQERRLQKHFFYDANGRRLVDFVGQFENIQEDFQKVCNYIDIEPIVLDHLNTSNSSPWVEYFTVNTFFKVRKYFAEDIAAFGYADEPSDYGVNRK